MTDIVDTTPVYSPSTDIVVREIEGEILIVPLAAGVADSDESIFTLNTTGRAIWQRIDGQRSLEEIIASLQDDYQVERQELETDVLGLVSELLDRKILVNRGGDTEVT